MATSEPELLSADELAKRIAASQRKHKIMVLGACWNWEIVAPAMANCMDAFLEIQDVLELLTLASKRVRPNMESIVEALRNEGKSFIKRSEEWKNLDTSWEQAEELQLRWDFNLVPGSLELPLAAQWALRDGYDGVLAIGAVIRGETEHFNLVCRECSAGLQQVALKYDRPVISGLLALENADQAEERIERAGAWAQSLLQMCLLDPRINR